MLQPQRDSNPCRHLERVVGLCKHGGFMDSDQGSHQGLRDASDPTGSRGFTPSPSREEWAAWIVEARAYNERRGWAPRDAGRWYFVKQWACYHPGTTTMAVQVLWMAIGFGVM